MAEHLADRRVLVGQLQNPIVVGIEPQTQGTEHQDLPLLHARATGLGADFALAVRSLRENFGENGEDLLAQLWGNVDVLQSRENTWNVISGAEVKRNGRNVLLAELQLWIDDLTQGASNAEGLASCPSCPLLADIHPNHILPRHQSPIAAPPPRQMPVQRRNPMARFLIASTVSMSCLSDRANRSSFPTTRGGAGFAPAQLLQPLLKQRRGPRGREYGSPEPSDGEGSRV
jgi:hypothetical protein